MMNYSFRYLKSKEDREDIINEVMMNCFLALNGFRGEASLKTWVTASLGNACKNFIRRQNTLKRKHIAVHLERDIMEEVFSTQEPDALERCSAFQIGERAAEKMKKLSPKRYKILYKCGLEQKSYEQAGRELGLSKNTIRSNLSRARSKLRRLMRNHV